MNSEEKFISISKTARYYTYGNLGESTKNIWLVFHGYGQLSKYFINKFESLDPQENYIIALEGLNKFYLKGFSGRIGATWMTANMREREIEDYINYIDDVIAKELGDRLDQYNVNILGFSQGCHTACRWVMHHQYIPEKLILWSGSLPNEYEEQITLFQKMKLYVLLGDQDELVATMHFAAIEKAKAQFPHLEFISFQGKHELSPSVFEEHFALTL